VQVFPEGDLLQFSAGTYENQFFKETNAKMPCIMDGKTNLIRLTGSSISSWKKDVGPFPYRRLNNESIFKYPFLQSIVALQIGEFI